MATFLHSGDLGDIIYSLPVVRANGPGTVYLNPTNGILTKFSKKAAEAIIPLLLAQPYVEAVALWRQQPVDYNLDEFRYQKIGDNRRPIPLGNYLLADAHLHRFNLPSTERDRPWLSVHEPIYCDVVVARSHRYHNPQFDWNALLRKYKNRTVFVGLESEYKDFKKNYGKLPWYPTNDLLQLARLIAGCNLFIGNQSTPNAIAEGLKVNSILEVCPTSDNCNYPRPNAKHYYAYPALTMI